MPTMRDGWKKGDDIFGKKKDPNAPPDPNKKKKDKKAYMRAMAKAMSK
jgi:hypothetical protein